MNSIEQVLKGDFLINGFKLLFVAHGYQFFDGEKPYNVNIFSIRSTLEYPGVFDDYLYLIYRDEHLHWKIDQYPVTTQAGVHYMLNPVNSKGTGILAGGQYLSGFEIRKHKGQYDALCQKLDKPVRVYRDNNRDKIYDYDPSTIENGYGFNIHAAGHRHRDEVGKYSAGCTVHEHYDNFQDMMKTLGKSARLYGNSFTYTLFEQHSFNNVIPNLANTKTNTLS